MANNHVVSDNNGYYFNMEDPVQYFIDCNNSRYHVVNLMVKIQKAKTLNSLFLGFNKCLLNYPARPSTRCCRTRAFFIIKPLAIYSLLREIYLILFDIDVVLDVIISA
jgi:hypothetical protein